MQGCFKDLWRSAMEDIILKEVLIFLDSLIVFSSSLEEHETHLFHVSGCLRDYGLKLSSDKVFSDLTPLLGTIAKFSSPLSQAPLRYIVRIHLPKSAKITASIPKNRSTTRILRIHLSQYLLHCIKTINIETFYLKFTHLFLFFNSSDGRRVW